MSVPSSLAYSSLTRRGLERMEFRLDYEGTIKAICSRYLHLQTSQENIRCLRAELEIEVRRVRSLEHVEDVPFYLHVAARDGDPTRLEMDLSVPFFKHDCDACRFLGRVEFTMPWREEAETFDLYTCTKSGYRTFVYRFGDEGPAYASCWEYSLPQGPHPALFECVRRARAEGL